MKLNNSVIISDFTARMQCTALYPPALDRKIFGTTLDCGRKKRNILLTRYIFSLFLKFHKFTSENFSNKDDPSSKVQIYNPALSSVPWLYHLTDILGLPNSIFSKKPYLFPEKQISSFRNSFSVSV